MRLARDPKTIILGKVIRDTEKDFANQCQLGLLIEQPPKGCE